MLAITREKIKHDLERGALSYSQIGERYGLSRGVVAGIAHRAGIKRPGPLGRSGGRLRKYNYDEICSLWDAGLKAREIAGTVGGNTYSVLWILRQERTRGNPLAKRRRAA